MWSLQQDGKIRWPFFRFSWDRQKLSVDSTPVEKFVSQGAFSIDQKIPETSKDVFHLTHSPHSFPGSLHLPMYFPPKYKMAAQLLLLNEMLDFSLEEESLVNSDDDDIPILKAVATYMRRDLHRNKGFYEIISPSCTIDDEATSGWLEGPLKLCAETYKPQEELISS